MITALTPFVPAKAGTQRKKANSTVGQNWIPAYAGMNGEGGFTRNNF
jgi:hypothetical protein